MDETEVPFNDGRRKDAIIKAINIVKKSGRPAELIICRDIPGHHTGGDGCFCGPKSIKINPKEKKD